jgi:hypothetical protein
VRVTLVRSPAHIGNIEFDGPDLYGESSFFETMPSRPSLQTALNISLPSPSVCSVSDSSGTGFTCVFICALPTRNSMSHGQSTNEGDDQRFLNDHPEAQEAISQKPIPLHGSSYNVASRPFRFVKSPEDRIAKLMRAEVPNLNLSTPGTSRLRRCVSGAKSTALTMSALPQSEHSTARAKC